eukprot:scaffold14339_cov29-Phaeocystis_antarctica.AAC.3
MVGEVVGARGASLGGPYGAAKAHCCVAVDESRSSLPACCVSFYQLSVCLSRCPVRVSSTLEVTEREAGPAPLLLRHQRKDDDPVWRPCRICGAKAGEDEEVKAGEARRGAVHASLPVLRRATGAPLT